MKKFLHLDRGEQRRREMRRCFFVCAAVLAAVSLGACSTTQMPQTASAAVPAGGEQPARHFSLFGRISVRVNDKIDSGQIRWSRGPDEERIGLYSPLGSQAAELVSDRHARTATLRQGKETMSAASVGELTQSLLGVPLDLDRLAEWAQGFGLRENEIIDVAFANGEVWRVVAERYQASGSHRFASRVTAIRGDTVVRLVIDEWTPQ